MPSYTHVSGTAQNADSASLSVPMPAGDNTGKLILIYASVRNFNGATVGTSPSGFTLLDTTQFGTDPASWVYGRIGTGTDPTVSFDTNTTTGQSAQAVAFDPGAGYGWPAIGSVLVGSSKTSSGSSTSLTYAARTISANDNLAVQFGKKPSSGTLTAIDTTSGFTQCLAMFGSAGGITTSGAQYQIIAGNLSANSVAITTEGTSSATGAITCEFAPVVTTSISVDDATIDPHPDTVITITKTAVWNGTVSATIEGTTITLTAINTTQKSFTLDIPDLLPGGAWNAISPASTATLAVTDSDGTFTTEVQIVFSPSIAEDYVASPGAGIGTYIAVPGAVTGDPHFAFWHLGDNVRDKTISGTTDAGTGYFAPITLPSQGRLIAYDVSGAVWLAAVNTDYYSEAEAAGGVVEGVIMAIVRPVVKSLVEDIT